MRYEIETVSTFHTKESSPGFWSESMCGPGGVVRHTTYKIKDYIIGSRITSAGVPEPQYALTIKPYPDPLDMALKVIENEGRGRHLIKEVIRERVVHAVMRGWNEGLSLLQTLDNNESYCHRSFYLLYESKDFMWFNWNDSPVEIHKARSWGEDVVKMAQAIDAINPR